MSSVISAALASLALWFQSRHAMQLEILALRPQLAVYQHSVKRPPLQPADRLFWAWLSRLGSGWQQGLEFVQPRTVIAWQKQRFRADWRRLSQTGKSGRPTISKAVRALIQDLWRSNPAWGAPRSVGELRKLGINGAQSTVEKYRPRRRKLPSPTWKAFFTNHVQDIVACDCFTVPTVKCQGLFVFIMLAHERRHSVHVHVTEHPSAPWTAQQIVETFPWDTAPRYLLRDQDSIYGETFQDRVGHMGSEEVQIAPRSPWQNPYCERVIGSIRRAALDHVLGLNERHLRRVLRTYVDDYHTWRTPLSLEMDAPEPRPGQPPEIGPVRKLPAVSGLHHHYER